MAGTAIAERRLGPVGPWRESTHPACRRRWALGRSSLDLQLLARAADRGADGPGVIPSASDTSSGLNPRIATDTNAARSLALRRPNAACTSSHEAMPSSPRSRTCGWANGDLSRRNRSVARRRVTTSNHGTTGRSQSTELRRSQSRVNASWEISSAEYRSFVQATANRKTDVQCSPNASLKRLSSSAWRPLIYLCTRAQSPNARFGRRFGARRPPKRSHDVTEPPPRAARATAGSSPRLARDCRSRRRRTSRCRGRRRGPPRPTR